MADQVGELRLDRAEDAHHGSPHLVVEVADLEDEDETVETESAGGAILDLALEDLLDLLVIGEEAEQIKLALVQRFEQLSGHPLVGDLIEMRGEKPRREWRSPENILNIPVFEFGVAARRRRGLPGTGVSRGFGDCGLAHWIGSFLNV